MRNNHHSQILGTLGVVTLGMVCASADASIFRTKLPVSLGAGLDHPLPLTALRGEVAFADRDTDKAIVGSRGKAPSITLARKKMAPFGVHWAACSSLMRTPWKKAIR